MALNEGQIVTLAVDEIIETISAITPMAQKAKKYTPPAASMQRSSNTIWMPVEQESPTQEGWDLTDKATGLLELNVAVNMGEPDNDFFQLRADDLRDETAYRRRIQSAARKLANNVELKVANMAAEMGSLVITSPDAIGTNTADARTLWPTQKKSCSPANLTATWGHRTSSTLRTTKSGLRPDQA